MPQPLDRKVHSVNSSEPFFNHPCHGSMNNVVIVTNMEVICGFKSMYINSPKLTQILFLLSNNSTSRDEYFTQHPEHESVPSLARICGFRNWGCKQEWCHSPSSLMSHQPNFASCSCDLLLCCSTGVGGRAGASGRTSARKYNKHSIDPQTFPGHFAFLILLSQQANKEVTVLAEAFDTVSGKMFCFSTMHLGNLYLEGERLFMLLVLLYHVIKVKEKLEKPHHNRMINGSDP